MNYQVQNNIQKFRGSTPYLLLMYTYNCIKIRIQKLEKVCSLGFKVAYLLKNDIVKCLNDNRAPLIIMHNGCA